MEKSTMQTRSPEIYFIPALLILCGVLFFAFLGDRPLWDIDEGMHAVTSKQMVLSRDWVTPYFNGEKFYDKPPLFNWLAALSFLMFGFTEFAARLPAALLGTGCVLLTYFGGRRMVSPLVGFLGAAILASSVEFIILSRVVVHDIALAFFVTLALFLFYAGYEDRGRRRRLFLWGYAAIGMSVVAKGPIGLIMPLMVVGLFLIFQRNLKFVKEMQVGWGVLIFLAVASPWYVLMGIKNPDYSGYFLWQQNVGNFFSATESRHPEPLYFYLPVLLGGFLPWSFFLPAALVDVFRGGLEKIGPASAYLLLWTGSVFLFFSAANSKLPTYILPMFPAVSLIVANLWRSLLVDPEREIRRWFLFFFGLLTLIFLAGTVYIWLFPLIRLESKYGIDPTTLNYLVLVLSVWGITALLLALKRRYRLSFSSLVALVACGLVFFSALIAPMINPYRSTKELGIELGRILPEGEDMVFFRRIRDSALFYTDRKARLLKPPEHLAYFQSAEPVYCILKESDLKWFKSMDGLYIISREGDRLLMSNRPLANDGPGS